MKISLISIVIFIITVLDLHAQVTKDTTWNRSSFVENTDDFISLKLNANNDIDRYVIGGIRDFVVSPNANVRNNFSLNYKWLTLGFTFVLPNLYGRDDKKGESKTSIFRLSFNPNKWTVDYSFKKNTGYYLENSAEFLSLGSDDIITFPNMTSRLHRLYIGHIINSKFSLKSLTTFTERQLQNSGSFIPFLRLSFYDFKLNEGFIGNEKANNLEVILGVSYTHKFVFKKDFYVAVVGSMGYGYLKSDINNLSPSNNTPERDYNSDLFATHFGGSVGYNGPRFFSGLNVSRFYNSSIKSGDSYKLDTERGIWEIFVGYRIRTPKFLRKPLKWADKQKEKVIN